METTYFIRTILNTFVVVDYGAFKRFFETFELLHPDYAMTSSVVELGSHRYEFKKYSCQDGEYCYVSTDLDYIPFS